MFELIAATVVAGVVTTGLVAGGRAVWMRRERLVTGVRDLGGTFERRRRRRARREHDRLVQIVLDRATIIGVDVPGRVRRRPGFVTVTKYPSGEQHTLIDDLPRYRELIQTGQLSHRSTHYRRRARSRRVKEPATGAHPASTS